MRAIRALAVVLGLALIGGCAHAGATPSAFPGEVPAVRTAPAAAAPPEQPAQVPVAPPTTTPAPATTATTAATTAAPVTTAPRTAPRTAVVAGLAAGTPCKATVAACVQLSTKKAWLVRDGKAVYGPVPITSGRPGWRTPPGTFAVTFKNINHKSSLFNNAPMPYSVFFNGGIAFHQGSLSVQSHGCIHLSKAAAQTFFSSLSKGAVVQVVA